jgi:hypothetical protein
MLPTGNQWVLSLALDPLHLRVRARPAFAAERKNRTPDPLFAIGRLPALEAVE